MDIRSHYLCLVLRCTTIFGIALFNPFYRDCTIGPGDIGVLNKTIYLCVNLKN